MSEPLRNNNSRRMTARGFSVPPSVGGLNARDELANMDERDALILENFFPEPSYLVLRKGYAVHATGMTGTIESLMEWHGPGNRKLKAAVGSAIYDVSSAGAVGVAEVTGLANARFQTVNFTTPGGTFLMICNGADSMRSYDGTTWATPAITVATSSTFIYPVSFKNRLWFVQKDTTVAWYLPTNSIAGAATSFDLGPLFKLGGKLVAIGTMSQDAGDGPDDYLCFVSSRGEIIIYQGTDPSSATTWAIVGSYRVGLPIGQRPLIDVGGDLAIISTDGVISIVKMMQLDRSVAETAAITSKIQNIFNVLTQTYGGNFGWQGIVYPKSTAVYFNVPMSATRYVQYVMNTITGSWCSYTNMNGACWGLLGDDLYFGGTDGIVYKADTGYFDNNGPITANLKTAWNYFKSKGQNKFFTLYRPVLQTNGAPSITMAMNTDFNDIAPTGPITIGGVGNSLWNSAIWSAGTWGGDQTLSVIWETPQAVGYCGSIRLRAISLGQNLIINSFDVQAQLGGPI